ncbi:MULTISPECIES: SDR family NAD(P)-dependent oxidoreductase [unclassified Shewanella]|uniref:SDR family NAD(P)-dependent oxidoreductase n=1 Tax=unclassified Shewanella TaxID=196818 RepID=UPI00354C042B
MLNSTQSAIIIGASSGIASAIVDQLIANNDIEQIITVSQSTQYQATVTDAIKNKVNLQHMVSDYTAESIAKICDSLAPIKGHIVNVFICNGRLHNQVDKQANGSSTAEVQSLTSSKDTTSCPLLAPEKRLEEINPESMQALFHSNTIVPMMWLQQLTTLLKGKQPCIITVLSARVGSISDNNLGGWYSYRASKAALNMLIKTTAIEYGRRANNVKLIAFHPGTTDTDLSKPFQHNVPEGKLFTTEFVAQQLLTIHQGLSFNHEAEFLDWQGKTIPW